MKATTTAMYACSAAALLTATSPRSCDAQVCQWGDFYGGVAQTPGLATSVYSMVMFDFDGGGPQPPQLVVSGVFARAGTTAVRNIATWTGSQWLPLADGLAEPIGQSVRALALFDEDGPGPGPVRLFAAGNFPATGSGITIGNIARWGGTQWEPVGGGLNFRAYSLVTWDPDSSGPEPERLVVGGAFTRAGNTEVGCVAAWDGQEWSAIDGNLGGIGGVSTHPGFPFIWAMTTLDPDGPGPEPTILYVGGDFSLAGGNPATSKVAWVPESPLGPARWDYLTPSVPQGHVYSLTTFDFDDQGPEPTSVVYGGSFAGGYICAWNPHSRTWRILSSGLQSTGGFTTSLRVFDQGLGSRLYAGGNFTLLGHVGRGIAVWEPSQQNLGTWRPVAEGFSMPSALAVLSLFPFDTDGPGPARPSLLAGGDFEQSGQSPLSGLALLTCPPCYANCDSSGAPGPLSIQDFVCFQSRFAIGDPYANCDGSTRVPTLNIADYVCFLNRFAAGCP